MMLYLLFAGFGTLIYTGVAYAEQAVSGFGNAHVAFGLQFAFFTSLSACLAAVILFYANRLLRAHASSVDRASAWRGRVFIVTLVFLGCGVAILIAATPEPGDSLACTGQCGAGDEATAAEASIISPNRSRAAVVGAESARALAAGTTLFHERGCVGCHRPDATGVGPSLHGLFGRPVQDQGCGATIVDESYLREAILNPSAMVAVGFPPVMPTFAGQLTEEELHALVTYVKSLSAPPQGQAR